MRRGGNLKVLLLALLCSTILYPVVSAEEVAVPDTVESSPDPELTPDPPVAESTTTCSVEEEDETLKKEEGSNSEEVISAVKEAAKESAIHESQEVPAEGQTTKESNSKIEKEESKPVQSGPFIDLLGETLISLKMVDESHAQLEPHYTNEALKGKKVVGLYFSADWCGPCRQFTPELVSFYNKMNSRRGKENQFEIVWVSRCRDANSFGQYFTHMNWLALPPEEAMGQRGQALSDLMKVKGIPHLVLLDEVGQVITYDARTKLPADKAGIGFPWRSPLATLYVTFVPNSLRVLMKTHVQGIKSKLQNVITGKKTAMSR